MKKAGLVSAMVVTAWMFNATAADEGAPQGPGGDRQSAGGGDRPQGGPGGEGGRRHPLPPLVKALDANGDGVIDASEIANASAALKSLDKNGDGKLTRDEIMPPRPPRPDGQQGGPGPMGDEPRRGEGKKQQGQGDHRCPPPPDGPDNQ